MKGLTLVGMLIALLAVGYLYVEQTSGPGQSGGNDPRSQVEDAERRVNESTEQRMERLKELEGTDQGN